MSRKRKSRQRQVAATPPLQPLAPAGRAPGVRTPVQRRVLWFAPWAIALVTFAAFLPTLQSQFVFDDYENFLENYHYRGLGWPHLRWMWTAFHLGHYIPLTWMTFGLDYLVWGMNPVGYHLTNLLLHATNAAVFYLLAFRILALALPGPMEPAQARLALSAGVAALLFAIHPLRVESVAWVTERRDMLSGLFYLLTILVYLRARDRGERDRVWYWGAVALFGCALLSKSMAVSLPVVLLILDVYPLRRLGGATGWWSAPARRVYVEKIPFFLLVAPAAAIQFMANTVMAPLDQLGVLGRLAISAYGLSFYLWKTVAPVNLAPLYELGRVYPWATPFLLSYGVVLAITALAWARRRRWPGLAAAWLAYIVILLPVLGVFQNGPQIAADRYTYLAGLGWAILVGAGLCSLRRRLPFVSIGLVVVVLVALGTLTWKQGRIWQDSEKLWTHALVIDPQSPLAHLSVGADLADRGKLAEAIEHYRQALHITPESALAHYSLGHALAKQGKLAEAIEHFQRALKTKPDYAGAHYNLGAALIQQGKPAEAIEHFQRALTVNLDYADAHNHWGLALTRLGKPAQAIEHYRRALTIKPDLADAHHNWGDALAQQGKLAEAIEHYRQTLTIKPDLGEALNNWGIALAQQGKLVESIEQFQRALKVRPDYADALNNWGVALTRLGKPAEAIEHFQRALKIRPDYADAHDHWGVALTRLGKPAEAIEHFQRALKIRPDYADAHDHWGVALTRLGKPAEAIEHFQRALTIKPDLAGAHHHWGDALAQEGKPAEAIEHYRQALTIKPDLAEALNNWGIALAQQGKLVESIEQFQRALKVRPDYADALNNWGVALTRQGKRAEADEHFQRALRNRPAGPSNTTSRP